MKKTIIFNVIANKEFGTGHVYRSLSLAHSFKNKYKIVFSCQENSLKLTKKILNNEYILETKKISYLIKEYNPILIVNDILNTSKKYIEDIKKHNIKTISFEDFGEGSKITNMTFNDLYDVPLYNSDNIFWGHDYYFLREEFDNVRKKNFNKKLESILILFGGTDPSNLTYITLESIINICKKNSIEIQVIVGPGYSNLEKLLKLISKINYDKLFFTNSTNIVSKIMEQVDFAISSNGRTVYELAHMNIPAIIIPVNKRENTHKFSIKQNGFLNLGIINSNTSSEIEKSFSQILNNNTLRHELYDNTTYFDFSKNRIKISNKIKSLIEL